MLGGKDTGQGGNLSGGKILRGNFLGGKLSSGKKTNKIFLVEKR